MNKRSVSKVAWRAIYLNQGGDRCISDVGLNPHKLDIPAASHDAEARSNVVPWQGPHTATSTEWNKGGTGRRYRVDFVAIAIGAQCLRADMRRRSGMVHHSGACWLREHGQHRDRGQRKQAEPQYASSDPVSNVRHLSSTSFLEKSTEKSGRQMNCT